MAYSVASSQYTRTYTTFSGCDLVATFGAVVIGELQAISYSISREKAPVYTLGSRATVFLPWQTRYCRFSRIYFF